MAEKKVEQEQPTASAEAEGISLQDASDIVALIDRLVEAGKVKGEEILRVGVIRTKLVTLIKKFSETE